MIRYIFVASLLLSFASRTQADERPNILFVMMDDLGYGHCSFNNGDLTVEAFDPYFVELVEQRQGYPPEQALEFSKRAMPTLDRLGKEGVIFTRAYAAHSLCAAARLAIGTGRNLPEEGVYTNMDVEHVGLEPGTHLAERLQDAGYATAHIGKWHMARRDDRIMEAALKRHGIEGNPGYWGIRANYPEVFADIWAEGYYGSTRPEQNPLANGFDYYYGYNNWASQFYDSTLVWDGYEHAGRQSGYNTEVFTDKTIEFIDSKVSEDQPFFVQLHYHAVHDFLEAPVPQIYSREFISYNYDLTNFYGHIYAVDRNVQRILDHLDEKGELENTIVVFTSDNGAMSGGPSVLPGNAPYAGHKGTFFQGGTRVPMFMHWPAGIEGGRESDDLVSTMDILPTVLAAAEVELPDDIDAKSLLGLATGADLTPVRDSMVWAGIHARRWGFLINRSFKNHYTELPFAPGGWAIQEGDYVLRFVGTVGPEVYHEWPDGTGSRLALYNLREDPSETTDIKDQMPELVERLKANYYRKAKGFRAPPVWSESKWEELLSEPRAQ